MQACPNNSDLEVLKISQMFKPHAINVLKIGACIYDALSTCDFPMVNSHHAFLLHHSILNKMCGIPLTAL